MTDEEQGEAAAIMADTVAAPQPRVRVWSGDTTTLLGDGVLVDYVRCYIWHMPDLSARSAADPTVPPTPEQVKEMTIQGGILSNGISPRIKLDSGKTVYGCQVWWTPLAGKQLEAKPEE